MFFVVVDGIFLAQVNKTPRVATPGSEGEQLINTEAMSTRETSLCPKDFILCMLDAPNIFLILPIPKRSTLSSENGA